MCDLIATGELKLNHVSQFVLDEAGRMVDLGFIRDIRRMVAALPHQRQSVLFSATMPPEIGALAETLLPNLLRVDVARSAPAALPIEQHVHFAEPGGKRALLGRLLAHPALSRVIVFTRTKRSANQVADALDMGGVRVTALHGNKSQTTRQKALEQCRTGRARVLVATDIAALACAFFPGLALSGICTFPRGQLLKGEHRLGKAVIDRVAAQFAASFPINQIAQQVFEALARTRGLTEVKARIASARSQAGTFWNDVDLSEVPSLEQVRRHARERLA